MTHRADEISQRVGATIRWMRKGQGLKQKALAERSGVSVRMLEEIEGGRAGPGLATLVKLARGLGVTTATIVDAAEVDWEPAS